MHIIVMISSKCACIQADAARLCLLQLSERRTLPGGGSWVRWELHDEGDGRTTHRPPLTGDMVSALATKRKCRDVSSSGAIAPHRRAAGSKSFVGILPRHSPEHSSSNP